MNKIELQEKLLNLRNELEDTINKGEVEKRELNDGETSRLSAIRSEIAGIEAQITEIDAENERLAKERENKNNNSDKPKQMRLFDLVKGIATNSLTEEQRAFVDGNTIDSKKYRAAIQATVANQGKENVPVDKMPLEVAIRNASVLSKIPGVTWFKNAVGDIKLVKYSGSNTYWADSENAAAADGAGTFSEILLQPKRLTSYITISRQFLEQSPEDAESILIADLARAVAGKVDETLFGAASGSTSQPAGLFYDSAYTVTGTALSSMTFDDVLDREAFVEGKNGTDFMFVCDPKVKYQLRAEAVTADLHAVWMNGEIDGRKTIVSNAVNSKSLLCFDPADLACADWETSIIVDPYTLAGNNQIKVVVNYLFDGKLKGNRIAAEIFS